MGDPVFEGLSKAHSKGSKGEPKITIEPQPAQSPDTNSNDLGFYSSIDSTMPKYRSFDLDKLYEQVETSFNTYPSEKLASLYETKSLFLAEILKANGGNKYTKPHKKKRV